MNVESCVLNVYGKQNLSTVNGKKEQDWKTGTS